MPLDAFIPFTAWCYIRGETARGTAILGTAAEAGLVEHMSIGCVSAFEK